MLIVRWTNSKLKNLCPMMDVQKMFIKSHF